MSSEKLPEVDAQLLDEFFGEADEHLVGMRTCLLRLESSIGKAKPDVSVIKELFQEIHSLKGIAAIVGLKPAEAVAHATEDFLRLIRDGKAELTRPGLQILTAATHKLEQVVAAFRSHEALPGYESLLEELQGQCEQWSPSRSPTLERAPISAAANPSLPATIGEAKAQGLLLWKFTFSPSRELDTQGVNINSVRERLSKIGQILNATSKVRGKDMLVFEFVVSSRAAPGDRSEWEAQGITIEPFEQEQGGPASSRSAAMPEETELNPFLAPSHIVRVDLKRLDDLMRITGEMVIHRSRLETQLARLNGKGNGGDLSGVLETNGSLGRSLKELREAIMRVRLIPVAEIFSRMPFVVRDLANQTEKKVRLKLRGQETAIDKYIIERLKDPLLHLVRNAFSHGVETPAERIAASKPEEATIELSASTTGDSVIIEVCDDGRGINSKVVVQRAQKLGLEIPEKLDNGALLKILCSSGFSTREDADLTSGRGVGMAVVQSTVRELGGSLALSSEKGQGTRFTIRLPLTLAIAETLIVESSGQTCAVPQGVVREILHKSEADVQKVNGIEIIPYKEGILPIMRLADFFHLPRREKKRLCVLVIVSDRGSIGLLTEKVIGQREVVVRALRDPLIQVPGISGATELGDGKPILILDGTALTRGAVRPLERSFPGKEPSGSDAKMI